MPGSWSHHTCRWTEHVGTEGVLQCLAKLERTVGSKLRCLVMPLACQYQIAKIASCKQVTIATPAAPRHAYVALPCLLSLPLLALPCLLSC
jgi:hypothetical protein